MLAVVHALSRVDKVPSSPSLLSVFILKIRWFLSNVYSVSIEIIVQFLSFILLIRFIALIDFFVIVGVFYVDPPLNSWDKPYRVYP